jgi:zinc/manganese transport system ATP-binding protein
MYSAQVTLKNLSITYNQHTAVHHVSGTFIAGSMTALAGPNGAGKSTLLKAIAGFIHPTNGSITTENVAKGDIAYLPQAPEINRRFPLTVLQMVVLGLWNQITGKGAITQLHRRKALDALALVGLQGFEEAKISTLSAGQFQRALFARVFLQEAPLILLDEPFTSMDIATTEKLLEVIQRWHLEKRTIICVLHSIEQIRLHFPHCMLMSRECVGWGKSNETLNPENLFKARMFSGHLDQQAKVLPWK